MSSDNRITNMAIVQLMKNSTAEYPITRPECVVFPDGTTANSRILALEDGINVMYDAYKSGYAKYHNIDDDNPPMFIDKNIFHAYQSANLDSIKKSYESILVKGVNNSCYNIALSSSVNQANEGDATIQVEETPGVFFNFSMKHFSSLMAGYAPKMIKMYSDSYNNTLDYGRLIFMDTVILNATEAMQMFGAENGPVKVLKLVMGIEGTTDNTNNVCELYFCPSCKITVDVETFVARCFVTNPYIVDINNQQ